MATTTTPAPAPHDSTKRPLLTLGPGTLILGSVGTQLDMSCQLTEIAVQAEGDSEDPENTLCGDQIAGARTYAWTLTGSAFQDVVADGLTDFTWKHAGVEMPFKFVPDSTGTAAVTGRVTVDPLMLGGTVKQKNKAEFEWGIVGTPTFDPVGSKATAKATPGNAG
jgi:hypothetical protein